MNKKAQFGEIIGPSVILYIAIGFVILFLLGAFGTVVAFSKIAGNPVIIGGLLILLLFLILRKARK